MTFNGEGFQSGPVRFLDNGDIQVEASSVAEAKLAIKQLKLKKREIANIKREVQQEVNAINAERRDKLAGQGRMVRGGGGFGRALRAFEGLSRDQAKAAHERSLGPHQQQKAALESLALRIDKVIVQLENYIHQQSV